MLHLLAYDIASEKRLRKMARICEDYGMRVEQSVFECNLDDRLFEKMWREISAVVCPDEDRVIDYPLGLIDRRKIREIGCCTHNEAKLTYVF